MAHARHSRKDFDTVLETYGTNDHELIKRITCHVHGGDVCEFVGMTLFGGSPFIFDLSDEAKAIIAAAEKYARRLVAVDWSLIERVAAKLLKAGRIERDDPLLAKISRITGTLLPPPDHHSRQRRRPGAL